MKLAEQKDTISLIELVAARGGFWNHADDCELALDIYSIRCTCGIEAAMDTAEILILDESPVIG